MFNNELLSILANISGRLSGKDAHAPGIVPSKRNDATVRGTVPWRRNVGTVPGTGPGRRSGNVAAGHGRPAGTVPEIVRWSESAVRGTVPESASSYMRHGTWKNALVNNPRETEKVPSKDFLIYDNKSQVTMKTTNIIQIFSLYISDFLFFAWDPFISLNRIHFGVNVEFWALQYKCMISTYYLCRLILITFNRWYIYNTH